MSATTTTYPATDAQMRYLNSLLSERGQGPYAGPELDKRAASRLIDDVKATPRAPRATSAPSAADLTFGVYRVGETVYRVYPSRNNPGRLFAAVITTDGFEYVGVASRFVKAENRLTLEETAEYGHQFGACCVCGRLLTVPASVAAGIGPDCASRY